jgi:hypothetical protein
MSVGEAPAKDIAAESSSDIPDKFRSEFINKFAIKPTPPPIAMPGRPNMDPAEAPVATSVKASFVLSQALGFVSGIVGAGGIMPGTEGFNGDKMLWPCPPISIPGVPGIPVARGLPPMPPISVGEAPARAKAAESGFVIRNPPPPGPPHIITS